MPAHTKSSKSDIIFGPKKLEDILSEGFRIYKCNYVKFWAISAVAGIIQLFSFIIIYGGIFLIPILSESDSLLITLPFIISGGVFIFIVLWAIGFWVQGALIYFIGAQYLDRQIGFSESYRYSGSRLGKALLASILISLAVGGLCLTIIGIPLAIYLGVNWCFALPCIFIQGTGITEALSKSYALVKGNWWRVLGINLMFFVIAMGINSIAGIIPFIGIIISTVVSTPVTALGLVLLFFDLRARKHNYTLDALHDELNRPNG